MSDPAFGPAEAALALNEAERAGQRARAIVFSSRMRAPLMVWGLVWLVCNLATQFAPAWGSLLWAPGVVLGVVVSFAAKRKGGGGDLRSFGVLAAVAAFITAVMFALRVTGPDQMNLLISLLVALGYFIAGLYRSRWLAVAGAALFVIVLAGWFFAHPWFSAWMGLAGGGCLVLSGLSLRRI